MKIRTVLTGCAVILVLNLCGTVNTVFSAEIKIGVMNMQKVIAASEAGKKAQAVIDTRMKELRESFKTDEDALLALKKEIEKKSSAWSEEMKQEKALEFKKKRRDMAMKQEDANLELKNLQEKYLGPILENLEKTVKSYAEEEKFTVILPRRSVLYFDDAIDVSDALVKALNKQMK